MAPPPPPPSPPPPPPPPGAPGAADTEPWVPQAWITTDGQGAPALLGGYSPTSGRTHFPIGPLCPYSGADDVEPRRLPRRGTLFAWTAVTAAPPGYTGPIPYGFGIVDLDGLRVIGRLTEADPGALRYGQAMEVVVETLPEGQPIWAFAPVAPVASAAPAESADSSEASR
jgi:uncharacterized protein